MSRSGAGPSSVRCVMAPRGRPPHAGRRTTGLRGAQQRTSRCRCRSVPARLRAAGLPGDRPGLPARPRVLGAGSRSCRPAKLLFGGCARRARRAPASASSGATPRASRRCSAAAPSGPRSASARCWRADARHVETLMTFGEMLRGLGRAREAADLHRAAADLRPGDMRPLFALAADWSADGNLEEARARARADHRRQPARVAARAARAPRPAHRRPALGRGAARARADRGGAARTARSARASGASGSASATSRRARRRRAAQLREAEKEYRAILKRRTRRSSRRASRSARRWSRRELLLDLVAPHFLRRTEHRRWESA